MINKKDFFKQRAENFSRQVAELNSRYNLYSFYRIAVFIVFIIPLIWFIKSDLLIGVVLISIVFILAFALLIKRHNQISRLRGLNQKMLDLNKEEVDRLNYEFNGIYNGDDFIDEKHPYTSDLDIFGRNSIFQLINRACTRKGISLIKSWFENASSRDVIETRQQAVTELRPLVDWRQKIQAFGRENSNKKLDEQPFYDWLEGDDLIKNNLFYRIIPYITIVFSISIIVGVIFGKLSFYFLLSPFIITGYFLFKIIDYSKATYEMTQTGVSILESVENIILQIENVDFEYNYLSTLRSSLMPQNIVASAKIKDLKTIFDWLSQRSNMMYLIFNSIFLLDFILLARAEKWRAKYKDEISRWFDAIAEFEALSSIAAFAFANEDYVFPEIAENAFFIRGTNLGHPLIPDDQRINNDFKLEGRGNSCIITGSNMAGKSTFLRTVGINAILAFTGAPVCADSFQISNVRVFTSMRTKDNLEENISSFYAELLRLKMLLEQINEDKPVLFLLDEILKGTNSADRHIGAESLILQLNEMNAFGLVSTHDLELGKLQRKNNQLTNYNFSSTINGEEIIFDYKLREGICKSTNASQLMAKIGIKIK